MRQRHPPQQQIVAVCVQAHGAAGQAAPGEHDIGKTHSVRPSWNPRGLRAKAVAIAVLRQVGSALADIRMCQPHHALARINACACEYRAATVEKFDLAITQAFRNSRRGSVGEADVERGMRRGMPVTIGIGRGA